MTQFKKYSLVMWVAQLLIGICTILSGILYFGSFNFFDMLLTFGMMYFCYFFYRLRLSYSASYNDDLATAVQNHMYDLNRKDRRVFIKELNSNKGGYKL